MWSLFRSELARFRKGALAFAALHVLVLIFGGRLIDLLQQPSTVYRVWGALYGLAGFLFGLYQLGSYRKPSAWLFLLHRPLAPSRIFGALLAASATLIALALELPLGLALLPTAAFGGPHVVDVRHGVLLLTVPALALSGYLLGAYVMLRGRWQAAAIVVLPTLLLMSDASGARVLWVHAAVVLWLAFLTQRAFRPDLGALPKRPLTVIATALPLQLAAYLLLLALGSVGYQLGLIALGTSPLNQTPAPGGYVEASVASSADLLLAGLGDRNDAQAQLWRAQIPITEKFRIDPSFDAFPVRGQLTNLGPVQLEDPAHHARWTFSHDAMRFRGFDLLTHRPTGLLGTKGVSAGQPEADRFAEVPLLLDGATVVTPHQLAQFDADAQAMHTRISLAPDEVFAAPPQRAGEALMVLSDRHLSFFDARAFARDAGLLSAKLQVPVPGPIAQLTRVDVAELAEGYLVSFTFGRGCHDGRSDGWQELVRVDASGQVTPLNRRALVPDFPALFRFREVWLSPALSTLERAAISAFAVPNPLGDAPRPALPREVLTLVALLAALSITLAAGWAWTLPISPLRKLVWIAICGAVGVPALVSFVLLNPRPERLPLLTALPA
jgi:hypothetical protein